ncbi:NADH-quinone oxidoreductase subunit G [Actinomyces marmotae]|uniref:NADH-quinone oxidoreductase subunit G n=1 Tax=Actinomyces marmotae TaxID=2737173 RepID=A0A6M8B7C6_9ACTO|nr:NADH-quinone oxidoreductase subunit G [Actinomyces marmotae]QKD79133.1 NADH-quinone oxidoreductase subunit G [Actinomyces marmotae]
MTEMVNITIDGVPVEVAKGTLLIRAAERIGVRIPRFCDHPLLGPSANCRQCLVEVAMPDREGNVRPMPKPQPSCAMTATEGMEISTQATSAVAAKAQAGTMEFLLINHPLDCPICDKAGECPLQNQALELMSTGAQSVTRFTDVKRTFPKPLRLTSNVLLDRDRCILCQRCVRFADEIAGDRFIALQGRGGGHPATDGHSGGLYSEQIGRFDSTVLDFLDPDAPGAPGAQSIRGAHGLMPAEGLAGPSGDPGAADGLAPGPIDPGRGDLDVSGRPFASYFSGNIIQICPVGALTSARYRFRARPVDLVSTPSVTEHDASGSAIRVDMRRGAVLRRLAGDDPEVNEEWITDKDRFAFPWATAPDRLTTPLVRDEAGELVPTSWSDALDVAARGLARAAADGGVGLLPGARLTLEDAWAWSRFARAVLGTNDIDQRVRDHSAEEDTFLAARVAGTGLGAVTYTSLETAGQVLLVGLEPEDECGSLFLRLRKGVRAGGVRVASLTSVLTPGQAKMSAESILVAPGEEARAVALLAQTHPALVEALKADGATILVGERAAAVPGLLTTIDTLATATGARLAWVPRRAGERGGIEAGALPFLLPGGRPVADATAREQVATAWGIPTTGESARPLPEAPGRDTTAILTALTDGALGGLVIGGVDLRDFPDPGLARAALAASAFTVQLEVRRSEVTEHADVVLPVAPPVEKNGTFVNWEGRVRPFGQAHVSRTRTDRQVLGMLAAEMGADLGVDSLETLHAELAGLGLWAGARPAVAFSEAPAQEAGDESEASSAPSGLPAVLATHKPMLDAGRLQDGETFLAATALRPVVRLGADLASRLGVTGGQIVEVTTSTGAIALPAVIGGVADGVVWLPECSAGSTVRQSLGAHHGSPVRVSLPISGAAGTPGSAAQPNTPTAEVVR